jgi:hypothetical protein
MSMQKIEVSAVMAPSALGKSAEMMATRNTSWIAAGMWPSTTSGRMRSPVACTPATGA